MPFQNKPCPSPDLRRIVKLADAFSYSCKYLGNMYEVPEARAIAMRLFEDLLGFAQTNIILGKDTILDANILKLLEVSLQRLALYMPVQYVTGTAHFRDLKLRVNQSVLIPRPETEELVQWILDDLKTGNLNNVSPSIWDIGTGSGAIAIALAREWDGPVVFASDMSHDALQVAHSNAQSHNVKVQIFQNDILSGPLPSIMFDVVVSNPPYVMEAEKKYMQPNVLQHEPSLALFVPDDDPLLFYRAISDAASRVLKRGGALYFEINENLGKKTADVLKSAGFTCVQIKKDFQGKERFVKGFVR